MKFLTLLLVVFFLSCGGNLASMDPEVLSLRNTMDTNQAKAIVLINANKEAYDKSLIRAREKFIVITSKSFSSDNITCANLDSSSEKIKDDDIKISFYPMPSDMCITRDYATTSNSGYEKFIIIIREK